MEGLKGGWDWRDRRADGRGGLGLKGDLWE